MTMFRRVLWVLPLALTVGLSTGGSAWAGGRKAPSGGDAGQVEAPAGKERGPAKASKPQPAGRAKVQGGQKVKAGKPGAIQRAGGSGRKAEPAKASDARRRAAAAESKRREEARRAADERRRKARERLERQRRQRAARQHAGAEAGQPAPSEVRQAETVRPATAEGTPERDTDRAPPLRIVGRVVYGDTTFFDPERTKVAVVDVQKVFERIPAYRTLVEEKVPKHRARYHILLSQANREFQQAVKNVAAKRGVDVVVEVGGVVGGRPIDITDDVRAEFERDGSTGS